MLKIEKPALLKIDTTDAKNTTYHPCEMTHYSPILRQVLLNILLKPPHCSDKSPNHRFPSIPSNYYRNLLHQPTAILSNQLPVSPLVININIYFRWKISTFFKLYIIISP